MSTQATCHARSDIRGAQRARGDGALVLRARPCRANYKRCSEELRFRVRLLIPVPALFRFLERIRARAGGGARAFEGRREGAGELPDELSDHAASPVAEAQSRELGEIVAGEVSKLPPRQREVLVLSAYEGMEHREIAAALEMTEQNVRVTLHLARERLKERLAKYLK